MSKTYTATYRPRESEPLTCLRDVANTHTFTHIHASNVEMVPEFHLVQMLPKFQLFEVVPELQLVMVLGLSPWDSIGISVP